MFPNKIKLSNDYIDLIVKTRKEHNLTAYQLSEKIGKNKSWLPNIENRRTKNISRNDLILLFKDFAKDEQLDTELYIIKHLNPNALIVLDDNKTVVLCSLLQRKYNLVPKKQEYNYIENDEHSLQQEKLLKKLNSALSDFNEQITRCFETEEDYPEIQTQIFKTLSVICENFESSYHLANEYYSINFLESITPNNNEYYNYISNYIKTIQTNFDFINKKALLYDYYISALSIYINADTHSANDLEDILVQLENFIHDIYEYTTFVFHNHKQHEANLHHIYSVAYNYLRDFIRISNLSYSIIDLKVPDNTDSKEIVNEFHLQLNNELFQIKKNFHEKYKYLLSKN